MIHIASLFKNLFMSDLNLFMPDRKKKIHSRKNDKIAADMRECFALELSRGDFPILPNHEQESRMPCLITITYVDLSPDLRNATVFYMTLGGERVLEAQKFFELQTHYFKHMIAKKMKLRYIPQILFKLDKTAEYSEKIESLLNKI